MFQKYIYWISKGVHVVYIFPFHKIISRHLCNFFFFCFLCLSTKEILGSISGMSDDHPTKCQLKKSDKLELEHCHSRGENEKQLKPPPSISCTIISKDDTYHHIPWDTHTHTSCYVISATSTYPCTHHPRLGCTSLKIYGKQLWEKWRNEFISLLNMLNFVYPLIALTPPFLVDGCDIIIAWLADIATKAKSGSRKPRNKKWP